MNDMEIESLKNELEHEKNCRESASWQNGEIEKQIMQMQEELRKPEYPWDHDDALSRESSKHKQLLDAIDTLKEQLPLLKEKIKNAKMCGPDCKLKHDDLNINLDLLTPLFVRVNDQRTYLQNELMICQNNIMRLQKNGGYWQNFTRKNDERVFDPKRGPIKKMIGNELLPPITT